MASRFEEEEPVTKECANCGAVEDLLRCSRCRSEWFCSLKCHRAYWPFHRQHCRANEFADEVEAAEPRFARWLRKHGKQAVISDNEVERLERASRACSGPGREEVMQGMYGRFDPKPAGPDYSAQELQRMRDAERLQQRQLRLQTGQDRLWDSLEVPAGLGMECSRYKWRQNQSHVEVFVRLPPDLQPCQVHVSLAPLKLCVVLGHGEQPLMAGQLYRPIKAELSTWFVDDRVLHVMLLKASRRGHYAAGTTNADTFWRSLWMHCPVGETLACAHPPTHYYWSHYEADDLSEPKQEVRPLLLQQLPPQVRTTTPARQTSDLLASSSA